MGRIQNSDNRILDISQAAAELIEMNERGYTPIRMVVMRGSTPEPKPAPPKAATNTNNDEPVYEDAPVSEVTAAPSSYDDDEYEDSYSGYEDYADEGYADETPREETASDETPSSPPPPVRPYPRQSESQTQPRQAAQPPAGHVLLKQIVVLINGKEQTIDVPEGVYIPLPQGQTPPRTTIIPPPPPPPLPPPPAKADLYSGTPASKSAPGSASKPHYKNHPHPPRSQ
jgi:hypothetical protein